MTRVEIPAYTDRWMMGDRYGEVVKQSYSSVGTTRALILHVRLDKSGKTVRVISDDCAEA